MIKYKLFQPLLGVLLASLLLAGCGGPAATQPPSAVSTLPPPTSAPADTTLPPQPAAPTGSLPLIYDDDGSPDGTTALMYLLSHPQADLQAINISYGEAHPAVYIQHIARQLDTFGITDIPLGYGQDGPLAGNNQFPEGMRESANAFWGLPIPNANKTYDSQPAADLIVSTVNQSPEPVTIFVTGPATNLSQALRLDPGIKKNIAAVYMMGGAVNVAGNIDDIVSSSDNRVAEWNIFADPQAAKELFESGLNVYLVPLDATNQVSITTQDTARWRQGGQAANFAADVYDMLINNWGVSKAAIWDLMTAAIMLKPDLCTFQPLHLQVVTQDGSTSGQTVMVPGQAPNVSVCLEPDVNKILETLVDTFSASPSLPAQIPPIAPTATPASQIFRDDFSGQLQPGWTWQNENPSRWSLTPDGWLEILGEDASLLANEFQNNLLCREAPQGEYQITLHLSAAPDTNFQQATLYLYSDAENYIAMNRGFCGPCQTAGNGMFMEYKMAGSWGAYNAKTGDTDVFLRLVKQGSSVTGYYAFEPDDWQRFGKIGNYIQDAKICLGVSNVDTAGKDADLLGRFDYIDISTP